MHPYPLLVEAGSKRSQYDYDDTRVSVAWMRVVLEGAKFGILTLK
jgi:hypothetical protein